MTAQVLTRTAPPRPARPRRALLRLHRGALIGWGVFVAVISAVLLWAYGPLGNTAGDAWQRKCTGDVCDWDFSIENYHLAYTLAEVAIHFMPIVIAVWAGSLLVGRELESGTARLAWTQSVTPTRWLAAKLVYPAVPLTAGTTVLVLLHRLLFDAHKIPDGWSWNDTEAFYANGTVAIAFPLLALALGALAGLVVRGSMAGVAAALATAAATSLITLAGPHLVPWKTSVGNLKEGYVAPADVIYGDEGVVTSAGAHIPDLCRGGDKACLAAHDVVGFYSDYHPSSQFWSLQLTQTALVLALTALATAAAFTVLRRRTA
jgi:hypothetical protein